MGKEMEEKNKYQEALDNAISDIEYCYNDSFEEVPEKRLKEVELLQQLVDKETPEDVEYISTVGDSDGYPVYDTAICPNCDREFEVEWEEHYDYCPSCGQKLKWWRDE